MKKVSLDTRIQLMGMLGVIASLIFDGLEMRQSQRLKLYKKFCKLISFNENPNLEFSQQDIAHRNIVQIHWFLFENDFYQYSQGLMDEPTWQAKLNGIKTIFDLCDVREIYKLREPTFSNEFKLVVQSLPDNCLE